MGFVCVVCALVALCVGCDSPCLSLDPVSGTFMAWCRRGSFFFFQADEGIRDGTGVQRCALPSS